MPYVVKYRQKKSLEAHLNREGNIMNGLMRLWKANMLTTILQAVVAAGFYYITVTSPRGKTEGSVEHVIFTLFELLLVSLLAGMLVSTAMIMDRKTHEKEKGRFTDLLFVYPGWVSVFALFCALWAVMAGAYGAETYSVFVKGWKSGGIGAFHAAFDVFTFLFAFLCYGGMFAFLGIGSFVCVLKAADENNAPRWVYGVAALPFGAGVIAGGALILTYNILTRK
ncbi:MAG: hypothetical protein HYT29_00905 [Parcubacteria group bacterium]|nr:hypothetical protein [Parcubacteria group bacterium]